VNELRLVKKTKEKGGKILKFTAPGERGYPDRIILLPGARVVWVELKKTGEKPEPLQLKRHRELRALGFEVYVSDSADAVDLIIEEVFG
jgi:hypothetical protein